MLTFCCQRFQNSAKDTKRSCPQIQLFLTRDRPFSQLDHVICEHPQRCRRDTEPSWYVDEATRVMKNVCRILIDQFYSHRQLRSTSSSSSSLSSDEEFVQRSSAMRTHHPQDLCQACQEGSCYNSNRQYYRHR